MSIKKKDKKILGLIPTRLNSTRLPQKALLEIDKFPLVIHTYKRAIMSKLLDEVYICCDDKKIFQVAKKFGANVIMTSKHHQNGTERIFEGYKKLKKNYDLIIDIQGDEPLISPYHIDQVISFHKKNSNLKFEKITFDDKVAKVSIVGAGMITIFFNKIYRFI